MFTEQPAPPPPIAEVQVHQVDATNSPTPAPSPSPLPIATPAPSPVPTPSVAAPEATEPTPIASPTQPRAIEPAPSSTVQHQQEVEQKLLELTTKSRVRQKQQQAEQAAKEAAKYAESGEIEEAKKVVNNSSLPANVRAALLKKIQAKQAKQRKSPAIAQKKPVTPAPTVASEDNAPGYGMNPGDGYAAAPIVPLSQAQLRLRFGQVFGRNLNIAFPLSIPAPITSLFGWRIHPISGSPRFHRGIDLGAPIGTPVIAAKAGMVETAGMMDGYGMTAIVRHGNTQQTLYAHMSQIYVQPGTLVKKGQLLGLVGSTGNSTGPHLHFEIHEMTTEGWVALDPAIALNGAIALAQHSSLPPSPSSKFKSFNLALSGLLDINTPLQILPKLLFNSTGLSGFHPSAWTFAEDTRIGQLPVPLALLSPALPELTSFISPLLEKLVAELSLPLPELQSPSTTLALKSLPVLAEVLPSIAVNPQVALSAAGAGSSANPKPLSGLTIAEKVPGAVRLQALQASQARPTNQAIRDQAIQPDREATRLQLSDRRINPLRAR